MYWIDKICNADNQNGCLAILQKQMVKHLLAAGDITY